MKSFWSILICLVINVSITYANSSVDTTELFFPNYENYEHIPGEDNFDVIMDRVSCIQSEIPLVYNTRVHAFVNYFAVKDREYTRRIIQKKNIYFPLFEKYLKEYGLPDQLKYLSIIESGLNPVAVSSARAVGLWQFMPATGRYFGLHQDWYIDERMDPEKATEAACRYLKQLYGMFGDWELAIAAYNTGPGNIRRAIRRSGYKKTFWEIYPYLYRETRSYLPQFVAMIYVLNYAQEHNFIEENLEFEVLTDTIQVNNYVHVETLSNLLNICADDLKSLNPALRQGVIPKTDKGYFLRIPIDTKPLFTENRIAFLDSAAKVGKSQIDYLAKNSVGSTYGREKIVHTVRSGDVLGKIAEWYNVRVSDIKTWNNLSNNTIRIGQKLAIYKAQGYKAPVVQRTAKIELLPDGTKTYIVQPGDTLWDISRKFEDLSIEKLKELNQLTSNKIQPGQKLVVGR